MAYKDDINFGFLQRELNTCVSQIFIPGNAIIKIIEIRKVDFFYT